MNKSKIATEIINDIYTFNSKYEKAKNKFETNQIDETKFAKVQYLLMCKLNYLENVIESLKEQNYKFLRYEKELGVLADLQDSIEETFKQTNLESLSTEEEFDLVTYLTKFENLFSLMEYEELKENV